MPLCLIIPPLPRQAELHERRNQTLQETLDHTQSRLVEEASKVAERDAQISLTVTQLSAAAVGGRKGAAAAEEQANSAQAGRFVAATTQVDQMLATARQLMNETKAMLERHKVTAALSNARDPKDECYTLLDANARLMLQVQQLTLDLQQLGRQSRTIASAVSPDDAETSVPASPSPTSVYSTQLPDRRGFGRERLNLRRASSATDLLGKAASDAGNSNVPDSNRLRRRGSTSLFRSRPSPSRSPRSSQPGQAGRKSSTVGNDLQAIANRLDQFHRN